MNSPLLVVLVSGSIALVTALVVAERSERHQRRNLLLAKLQDLHVAVDSTLSAHIIQFAGGMAHLRYGTPHGKNEEPGHLEIVHAIVGLYFPEIDPEYDALTVKVNAYRPLLMDALLKRPATEQAQIAACHALTASSAEVHRALRAIQAKAVIVARRLVTNRGNTMNQSQRLLLVVACVVAALMLAVPPWSVRSTVPVGSFYRALGQDSAAMVESREFASVLRAPSHATPDVDRLLLQFGVLAFLVAGGLLALSGHRLSPANADPATTDEGKTTVAPEAPAKPTESK